jgi:hypothetical protein
MSRHCQHRSTDETRAISAYLLLACRECHEHFNHEASQSSYGACLSAAGDKAELLCSTFSVVKMLQFNSSSLAPNIIRMALSYICQKAKTIVVLVVCCAQRPKLRWLPHMDMGNPPFRAPFGARQVHTEGYSYYCYYILTNMWRF